MKKKLTFAVLFLALFASASWADSDSGIVYGGFGGFNFGGIFLDQGKLNDWLDDAGVEELPAFMPIFGGSMHAIMLERVVVGMRGGAFFNERSGDYVDVEMGGGFFIIDVGYAAVSTRRWMLFPYMGIGGAGTNLELKGDLIRFGIWPEDEQDDDGRDSTTSSGETQKAGLGWGYMTGHVGLSFYHNVPFTPGDDAYGMAMFGVTIGGMMELTRSSYQDKEIINKGALPSPSFNGAYVQLEILFGGGTTKYPDVRRYRLIEIEEDQNAPEPEEQKEPQKSIQEKEKTPPGR